MNVFVMNMRGEPLMPCSHRKARILLKSGKARIFKYNPFTIQLNYATGETVQKCNVGVATGSKHVGIAVVSENNVLFKADVELRHDIKQKIAARHEYRRTRRYRNTRYRKSRFLNRRRNKNKSWIPPSTEARVNATFRWIDEICSLLPNHNLYIEIWKFNISELAHAQVHKSNSDGVRMNEFYNNRYFVLARDNYTCQVCKKSDGKILQTHHIIYRSKGGSNNVNNLITVCTDCHTYANHQHGGILYKWMEERKKVASYKEPIFLHAISKRIVGNYPDATFVYGSEITPTRKDIGLPKSSCNDAIAATGVTKIRKNSNEWLLIRQFRKKKRSLHEANARKGIKEPNRLQSRHKKNTPSSHGFFLNDKVRINAIDKVGYISGFCGHGCLVKDEHNFYNYLKMPTRKSYSISFRTLERLSHNNNWQFVRMAEDGS